MPDEKLAKFGGNLTFLDAIGYQFYLPAYLCFALRRLRMEDAYPNEVVSWLWGPAYDRDTFFGMWSSLNGDEYHQESHYPYLTDAQKQAVVSFLQCFAVHGFPSEREDAAAALAGYWGQFLSRPASP